MFKKILPAAIAVLSLATVVPALQAQTGQRTHSSFSTHTPARKYNFALVTKDGNISSWGDFDSTSFDGLRNRSQEDTLYVKKDGVVYSITDRGTVSQAKAAMEPMEKLGRQQGELGREQGKLGRQQGDLGRKQGEYGRKLGELGRELGSQVRDGGSTSDVNKRMQEVSKEMQGLGKEQSALGEKQRALGAKQSELGKQQGQAAREAEEKVTKLIDDAFAKGLAKKD